MKKLLAMLLTGCIIFQPLQSLALTAYGGDLFEEAGEVSTAAPDSVGLDDLFSADPVESQDTTVAQPTVPDNAELFPEENGGEALQVETPGETLSVGPVEEGLVGDLIVEEAPEETLPEAETPEETQPLDVPEDTESEDSILDVSQDTLPEESESEEEIETESELLIEDIEGVEETVEQASLGEGVHNAKIQVQVGAALPFDIDNGRTREVTVAISGGDVSVDPVSVELKADNTYELVEFSVAPGTYKVFVRADKFKTYTQTIEDVKEYHSYKVQVYTAQMLTGREQEDIRIGWMQLGDVNGDENITTEDRDAVLAAIHSGSYEADLDLNANNAVDLADLQYVINGLNTAEQISTIERTTIPREVDTSQVDVVDGDINDLFKDEGGNVQLKPKGEGNISPENPVEISFGLVSDDANVAYEDIPKLEGLTIQTPAAKDNEEANPITSGFVYVEVENETGETETLPIPIGNQEVKMDELEEILGIEKETELLSDELLEAGPVPEESESKSEIIEQTETETSAEEFLENGYPADDVLVEEAPVEEIPMNDMSVGENVVEPAPDSEEEELLVPISGLEEILLAAFEDLKPTCKINDDGSIEIDFGAQVAVKRVTIKIEGTKKESDLVDIAKVEFVNDMDSRVPEPELNKPEFNKDVIIDNEEFEVSWKPQTNVTGYVLTVSGVTATGKEQTQEIHVAGTSYRVAAINDEPLKNYNVYTLTVKAVNGKWMSPPSDPITAIPAPKAAPDPVDNVVVTGGYRSIHVSWKDMKDAIGYMVYYKESSDSAGSYKAVVANFTATEDGTGKLLGTSYNITGLLDNTEYSVRVVSWNDYKGDDSNRKGSWGNFDQARSHLATTKSAQLPILPMYKAINGSDPYDESTVGKLPDTIEGAVIGNHNEQKMYQSSLDERAVGRPTINGYEYDDIQWGLGVVDNNYESYWMKNDWDDGVAYPINNFSKGITVTLNQDYEMNYLTFTATDLQSSFNSALIGYWSEADLSTSGKLTETEEHRVGAMMIPRNDKNGNPYFIVRFDKPVKAKMIHLYLGRYGSEEMKVAEIRFHKYDTLDGDIYALYKDDMHTVLADGVDSAMIDGLEQRLEAGDEETGEKHPLYDLLKLELKNARKLLEDGLTAKTIVVNPNITPVKDQHLGFGGLNPWQPLGKVVDEGEPLIVYVGHNAKPAGQNASLALVFTQYHAESNAFMKTSVSLKVGRNEITVPQISTEDMEHSGQLYVYYGSNNPKDQYGIRVQGGKDIPVLNLYGLSGQQKTTAIQEYVNELGTYVTTIEANHAEHANAKNAERAYDEKNCSLNSTDIMMEHMMYSIPATQVWAEINSGTSDPAGKLETSLDLMEELMKLFYQHKGLSNFAGAGSRNALPSQHLNIRYMQMFSGAFMYASGNHIGVEWNETKLAAGAGRLDSFGWGVAHEIGHDINQSKYAVPEITNNYFAQLMMKAADANAETRVNFEKIYKKVTSGTIGRSSDLATQLGLYWQLHLAFDNHADSWTASNYDDLFHGLFFARVDTYARTPEDFKEKMKKKGKSVADLNLDASTDQNLMRLSCAAAEQDILDFFRRWGMVPDAETVAFADSLKAKNSKALWYVSDAARDYRISHTEDSSQTVIGKTVNDASLSDADNTVTIKIPAQETGNAILGYEILRTMRSDGKESGRQVIGFAVAGDNGSATYTDTIASIDNRVLNYYVKAVDKFLNYSEESFIGSEKVETGGVLGKSNWSVKTENLTSVEDTEKDHNDLDPDAGMDGLRGRNSTIERVIDGELSTTYSGNIVGGAGSIIIDMGKVEEVTSLRITGGTIANLDVAISTSGDTWDPVKTGYTECAGSPEKNYYEVWFDSADVEDRDKWIGTYDARFVRLTIKGQASVTITEIDLCGPTGDNVEFLLNGGIGKLKEDYVYGDDVTNDRIPAGSLIFTGTYKGNPAFNVVMLYDNKENVVGVRTDGNVEAAQVILADVPTNGYLGTTSEGYWVYFLENPDTIDFTVLKNAKIRAELYRVDDAFTLKNERIVSDTEFIDMPYSSMEEVPEITLTGKAGLFTK